MENREQLILIHGELNMLGIHLTNENFTEASLKCDRITELTQSLTPAFSGSSLRMYNDALAYLEEASKSIYTLAFCPPSDIPVPLWIPPYTQSTQQWKNYFMKSPKDKLLDKAQFLVMMTKLRIDAAFVEKEINQEIYKTLKQK